MNPLDSLNSLKKDIFFEFLNLVGKTYILVQYSENVILGNRKFTEEEKSNGIVLVFNTKMNFLWDDYGISATLVFNTSSQRCFIPVNDIVAVYSPELNAQFITAPNKSLDRPLVDNNKKISKTSKGNVIEVDFTKKRD
jgi:stringent starvation protein B